MQIKKFLSECRCVVSVEFALGFPILITLLVASVAITNNVFCHLRVTMLARTVAGLEAGSLTENITRESIQEDLNYGIPLIISPLKATSATVRVSGLQTNANGDGVVKWSEAYNTAPYGKGQVINLNSKMKYEEGLFLVFTEASYRPEMTLAGGIVLPNIVQDEVIMFPNNFAKIDCNDC